MSNQQDEDGFYRDAAGNMVGRCGSGELPAAGQRTPTTYWKRCHRCGTGVGQVSRLESDIFDCLNCGAMTYVKGCNTSAPPRLRALGLIAKATTLEEAIRIARRAIAECSTTRAADTGEAAK